MNVGDYVRTKDGLITKFEREDDIFYVFDKMISTDKDINKYVNISPNIIDLIEVGDYVNGSKVIEIDKENEFISTEFAENLCVSRANWEIKSIVTKEQFESMEYKVGNE